MRILIPGAGGKILHILNFQEIPEVESVAITEIYPWTYGTFIADESYLVPRFDDPDFFTAFERLHREAKFDVCIPIHDVALFVLSENRDRFGDLPFVLAMNPRETIDIAADKLRTYEFFIDHSIPTATTYTVADFLSLPSRKFPYFIKPRYISLRGTAQQLYMKLDDDLDVDYAMKKISGNESKFVVQDFVDGTEINIDFFCDADGEVKSVVPLKRLAMGASRGISRGEIVMDDQFEDQVKKIAREIKLWGANNVQVYVGTDGKLAYTEINCRFSGSSVLVKEAGVNYFHYFVKLLRGEKIEIKEKPRFLRMSSYEKPFFYVDPVAKTLP